MGKSFRDAARRLLANNAAAASDQASSLDDLVEAMACVLDAELDARVYTLRLDEGDHVTLVDGDLHGGTPELARDVLNALHERGWHFSRGTVCP